MNVSRASASANNATSPLIDSVRRSFRVGLLLCAGASASWAHADAGDWRDVFPDAVDLGHGWIGGDWSGPTFTGAHPWYYSATHAWFYAAGDDWFFDLGREGWMWTHAGVFPWVFEPDFREWLAYMEGASPNRVFFHDWGSTFLPERPDLRDRAMARARGILDFAEGQQRTLLNIVPQADQTVELYSESEGWKIVPTRSWVSGFLPASIWLNYHWSGLPVWQMQGERRLDALEVEKTRTTTHDLGFMIGLPFSLAYDLTGDPAYADVLVTAAGSLASRFNSVVGATRSWSHGTWATGLNFTVIVDNMMNMELLLRASALPGGDAAWYDMALTHARTTIRELLREDAGTYHVAIFNRANGEVLSKLTHQGYNDQSTWSRGQAWALYGFALMYAYTGEEDMRTAGKDVATYFMDNLPANGIVPWDFDAPGNEVPTDTSASAVAAAGLFRLADALGHESAFAHDSLDAAYRMIIGLSKWPYLAVETDYGALLLGGSRARDEYEQSLIYGDYYLQEACQRLLGIFPGEGSE